MPTIRKPGDGAEFFSGDVLVRLFHTERHNVSDGKKRASGTAGQQL